MFVGQTFSLVQPVLSCPEKSTLDGFDHLDSVLFTRPFRPGNDKQTNIQVNLEQACSSPLRRYSFAKGPREKDYKCLKMMRNMDKERSIEANDGYTVVLKKMARMDLL